MQVVEPRKWDEVAIPACTGAAWLSSARVVRCWVKSRNERNPCVLLPPHFGVSTLDRLPRFNEEEGGDDVKSVWPLRPGLHTYYNARYKGKQERKLEQIPQNRAQFRLPSATRRHEAGIASNGASATAP